MSRFIDNFNGQTFWSVFPIFFPADPISISFHFIGFRLLEIFLFGFARLFQKHLDNDDDKQWNFLATFLWHNNRYLIQNEMTYTMIILIRIISLVIKQWIKQISDGNNFFFWPNLIVDIRIDWNFFFKNFNFLYKSIRFPLDCEQKQKKVIIIDNLSSHMNHSG